MASAVAPHDDGNVWEDSCCELFLSPVADGTYYNLECNAAGTLLIGFGAKREGRERAPQSVLDKIDRWSSMGRTPFSDIAGERTWQLCLAVLWLCCRPAGRHHAGPQGGCFPAVYIF